MRPSPTPRRCLLSLAATISIGALVLSGCSAAAAPTSTTATSTISAETATFFNNETVHDIGIEAEDLTGALEDYATDSTKTWVKATVTIDGTTFDNVGLRLKGNSSLRGTTAEDDPAQLPWIIRLDKYVDGQQYSGRSEFVVRGNSTQTSLNEALALELVGGAGLATQHAAATRFSVNGSEATLRLVIDNPDDTLWSEETFGSAGITYEAESNGDYSYRGANGEDYADAFTAKSGDETNLQPIADFLEFVNNSSDEDFASQLGDRLEVDQFASYLAVQELIGNMDDIDGPGNNSYLRYNESTGKMSVVSWDLNMAFGAQGGAGERPQRAEGTDPGIMPTRPEGTTGQEPGQTEGEDAETRTRGERPGGRGGGGFGGGSSNPLSSRFLENEEFAALYEQKLEELQASLFDSGLAEEILDTWSALLLEQATDLVDADTVDSEVESLRTQIENGANSTGMGGGMGGNRGVPGTGGQGSAPVESARPSAAASDTRGT
ncbi:CotH kinase family protein [Glutamicibacter sp. MNS18]|uniref:CotH kinase family protein n=1 Tax=Glutamicibacter sp. MNS18 TaxID=2989817 RepID=UPI002235AE61|nr:CotH kinase family protein [Glutamicibacter sp. MNS18]MCW4466578.1 CotH kinase family protein [Glutamicibacter sp. MNS18]